MCCTPHAVRRLRAATHAANTDHPARALAATAVALPHHPATHALSLPPLWPRQMRVLSYIGISGHDGLKAKSLL